MEKHQQALEEALAEAAKGCLRIQYHPGEKPSRMGASKFGGRPHLPAGFVWPWYDGETLHYDGKNFAKIPVHRPLSFLCQIDLAEAAPLDKTGLLPKSGLLSFFYELDSQPWGYDPDHKGAARVCWTPAEERLVEVDFPPEMEEDFHLPEQVITLTAASSLPSWDDLDGQAPALAELLGEDDDNYQRYQALAEERGCFWQYDSHLLGWPDLIQNPMEIECEQVIRGYALGHGLPPIPPEEKEAIEAAAGDWVLLLQMGTVEDEDFELMWGDCGCIYFWIKKQDLAAGNFDRVWLILQCG